MLGSFSGRGTSWNARLRQRLATWLVGKGAGTAHYRGTGGGLSRPLPSLSLGEHPARCHPRRNALQAPRGLAMACCCRPSWNSGAAGWIAPCPRPPPQGPGSQTTRRGARLRGVSEQLLRGVQPPTSCGAGDLLRCVEISAEFHHPFFKQELGQGRVKKGNTASAHALSVRGGCCTLGLEEMRSRLGGVDEEERRSGGTCTCRGCTCTCPLA